MFFGYSFSGCRQPRALGDLAGSSVVGELNMQSGVPACLTGPRAHLTDFAPPPKIDGKKRSPRISEVPKQFFSLFAIQWVVSTSYTGPVEWLEVYNWPELPFCWGFQDACASHTRHVLAVR